MVILFSVYPEAEYAILKWNNIQIKSESSYIHFPNTSIKMSNAETNLSKALFSPPLHIFHD